MTNLALVQKIFIKCIKEKLSIDEAYVQLCSLGLKIEDILTEIHKIYNEKLGPTSISAWERYIELTTKLSQKFINSHKVINFPTNPSEEQTLTIIAVYEECFGIDDDISEAWLKMSMKEKYNYIASFEFCK